MNQEKTSIKDISMKTVIAALIITMALFQPGFSQNVNWRSMQDDQRNIIQFDFGYDYGVTTQLGYGRAFDWIRPAVLTLDYSLPMGKDLVDDFKVRLGGQVEVLQIGGLSATLKLMSSFRRYENPLVRIVSFGSDFDLVTGYYTSTWYTAGEFGFDKSIVSHLKHSDIMRSNFPAIRDGWYIPSGGHYYYGIQAGKTLGETYTLLLRAGTTNAQFDDEDAVVPYYVQVGMSIRF
jgi:hypothetical protein